MIVQNYNSNISTLNDTIVLQDLLQNIFSSSYLNLYNASTVCSTIYYNNSYIKEIYGSKILTLPSYVFYSCALLEKINFSKCTTIGYGAFARCEKLTVANFNNCSYIAAAAFQSCKSLVKLYLLSTSMTVLQHENAFYGSPIGGNYGIGSIYVPASLLSSYTNDTVWKRVQASGGRFVGV